MTDAAASPVNTPPSTSATATDPASSRASRFTPLLWLLFAASGAAALVYELVWFHLLRLSVGASAISLAFLLGSFMGGMCLGSWLLPRLLPRHWHPLRVYALLELGIGVCGAAMPLLLPVLGRLYAEHGGADTAALSWRGAICALALLPPTVLMGATLPAIARWLDSTPRGLAQLGRFYGANISGAVLGTLTAGFWLLPTYDVRTATWVAVGLNVAIAAIAMLCSWLRRHEVQSSIAEPAPTIATPDATAPVHRVAAVHVAIAFSGFTALGGEIVWTRLLSLLLGATVYTFTLILAVYLLGLGIGSAIGSRLARRSPRPGLWFAACQFALAPALLWAAFLIAHVLPYGEPTYIFQWHVYQNMPVHFAWDMLRIAPTLLPATLLWGASFPLALAAAGNGHRDPGRLVGGLYAANTIGAIAGALLVGLFAIDAIGTQRTQQWLGITAGIAAVFAMLRRGKGWLVQATAAVGIACVGAAIALLVPRVPNDLIGFGRSVGNWGQKLDYRYVAEGTNASCAVTEMNGYFSFHVSGKVEASTEPIDMRLQRLLGHLPALVHGAPRKVLVVGCGAGVTAGCFALYPSVERIVICELEPRVIDGSRTWLGRANHDVLRDPRTEIVIDDGRHFLATTKERFDVITSDPIHPWVRGVAALYTSEYHELVRQHLAPGGVVTQWVPLYETDEPAAKSQIGTFLRAFPHGTLWTSDLTQKGYDLAVLATDGPLRIDVDAVQARLDELQAVRFDLDEVQLPSAVKLLSTYAGAADNLTDWLADAPINVDQSLRLQYLAGLALDHYVDEAIYGEIKRRFTMPEDLFVGDPATLDELRQALQR